MMNRFDFGRGMNNFNGNGGFMWIGGIFMFVCMLLLLAGISYLVFRHIKHNAHNVPSSSSNPLEILKIRYAKGEITDLEYAAKKEELLK